MKWKCCAARSVRSYKIGIQPGAQHIPKCYCRSVQENLHVIGGFALLNRQETLEMRSNRLLNSRDYSCFDRALVPGVCDPLGDCRYKKKGGWLVSCRVLEKGKGGPSDLPQCVCTETLAENFSNSFVLSRHRLISSRKSSSVKRGM